MVRLLMYKQIKCKKNKSLFLFIDKLTTKTVHVIKEILKWITDIPDLIVV